MWGASKQLVKDDSDWRVSLAMSSCHVSGSLQTTTCSNAAQWFTYWMNREQTFKHTMVGYLSYLERGALLILIRF